MPCVYFDRTHPIKRANPQCGELSEHAAPDGTVTILFSDVENSTVMTERLGDLRAQELMHGTLGQVPGLSPRMGRGDRVPSMLAQDARSLARVPVLRSDDAVQRSESHRRSYECAI